MRSKGGRPATGSVKWKRNARTGAMQWFARVTFPKADGQKTGPRRWVELDPRIPENDEAAARACAKDTSAEARGGDYVATPLETVAEWSARWLADRTARGLSAVRDGRSHLTHHVLPRIGHLPMARVTRTDLESLVEDLDRKVRLPLDDEHRIAWKTARNVWATASKMFDDAARSKRRDLRAREDNPAKEVRPPDRGAHKAKQYLYPSEFLRFVSCADVPLRWRRVVALAIYLYPRDGELRVLRWEDEDVDLEHDTIHIHRAFDRRTRRIKTTKTGHTRRFTIERELVPLLASMKDEACDEGPIAPMPSERDMARGLRRWLKRAGVTRRELHEGSPTLKPITFHDLRATGLTWMAIRGDEPLRIMQRAGHTDFQTTQIYIREAENLRDGFGEPFPPLPVDLVKPPGGVSARFRLSASAASRDSGFSAAFWRGGRDSKPSTNATEDDETQREVTSEAVDAETKHDGRRPPKPEAGDAVEAALARALDGATRAQRWDVVAQLARELEARRRVGPAPAPIVRLRTRDVPNG